MNTNKNKTSISRAKKYSENVLNAALFHQTITKRIRSNFSHFTDRQILNIFFRYLFTNNKAENKFLIIFNKPNLYSPNLAN